MLYSEASYLSNVVANICLCFNGFLCDTIISYLLAPSTITASQVCFTLPIGLKRFFRWGKSRLNVNGDERVDIIESISFQRNKCYDFCKTSLEHFLNVTITFLWFEFQINDSTLKISIPNQQQNSHMNWFHSCISAFDMIYQDLFGFLVLNKDFIFNFFMIK